MKSKRLSPEVRREQIMTAVMDLSLHQHYATVSRDQIADVMGVSGPLVQFHYGKMYKIRDATMQYAIANRVLHVIAQGIVAGDKLCARLDPGLRAAALGVAFVPDSLN